MTAALRGWRRRLLGLVVLVVVVLVLTSLLDLAPDPVALALVIAAGCGCAWLVLDTLDTRPARWRSDLPGALPRQREDRRLVGHHRRLESHLTARDPGPALADALVALARLRDPTLTRPGPAAVVAELADPAGRPRRLTPDDVDRHLTRIEEP